MNTKETWLHTILALQDFSSRIYNQVDQSWNAISLHTASTWTIDVRNQEFSLEYCSCQLIFVNKGKVLLLEKPWIYTICINSEATEATSLENENSYGSLHTGFLVVTMKIWHYL